MEVERSPARLCLRCGYDLRALAEARCPECGLEFNPNAAPPAQVPWMRRSEIGWVAAYARTVWLLIARPREFAEQAWHWVDVNPRDGELFRRMTIFLASASVALSAGIVSAAGVHGSARDMLMEMLAETAVSMVSLLIFFAIGTMQLDVKLRPDQPRAVAARFENLQDFSCAPLGFLVLMPVATLLARIFSSAGLLPEVSDLLAMLLVGAAVLLVWYASWARLLARGAKIGGVRTVYYMFAMVLLWFWAVVGGFVTVMVVWPIAGYLLGRW